MLKYPFGRGSGKKKGASSSAKPSGDRLSYDQIHGNNRYDESLKEIELTKAYSVAEAKLKSKPYAERKFKAKENIIRIRSLYPYLSVFLSLSVGILTGDLFASGLSEMAYYLTLGILTVAVFLVAWLLEDLKRDACRDYFATEARSRTSRQRFWLNSLFMYSVIISGIGGYVASIHLNDRTAEIEQTYQTQSDSVSTGYGEQIAVLNTIIEENKKRMQSPSKWTRYHAQKDLTEAQKQKTELLKLQNNTLSEIKTEKKAELTAGDLVNQYKAYVLVLVVFLFEILYIRSYAYEYAIERKIKEENQKFNIVATPKDAIETQQTLTLQDVAMEMLLANLTQGNLAQGLNPALQATLGNQGYNYPQGAGNVGFQFGKITEESPQKQPSETDKEPPPKQEEPEKKGQFDENTAQMVPEKSKKVSSKGSKEKRIVLKKPCVNCGTEFVYQNARAKYCSDKCRKEAWEKRTGKTMKNKPKKK